MYLLFAALTFAADLAAFDPLLGKWEATGEMRKVPVRASFRWDKVLNGKFVRMQYATVEIATGKTLFEGTAYYRPESGTWFDSNGAVYAISWAAATPGKIDSEWGPMGSPYGRSQYAWNGKDELQITDLARNREGAFGAFAKYTARRAK